jgi:hypothetical protein
VGPSSFDSICGARRGRCSATTSPDCPESDLITDDPTVDLGTTGTVINHTVCADLALDVVELPLVIKGGRVLPEHRGLSDEARQQPDGGPR